MVHIESFDMPINYGYTKGTYDALMKRVNTFIAEHKISRENIISMSWRNSQNLTLFYIAGDS